MIKPNLLKQFAFDLFSKNTLLNQVKKHWFKLGLVCLFLYFFLSKDINFEFSMSTAKKVNIENKEHDLASNVEAKTASFQFSEMGNNKKEANSLLQSSFALFDFSKLKSSLSSALTPVLESNEKKEDLNVKANNFSSLAFVLSPSYIEKVSADIVKEKNTNCADYVKQYASLAISEMKKYGIPASIILAQGLLESNAGDSKLTKASNNHFGIKCFSKKCKKGHCKNFSDDSHKDFFLTYKTAWDSFRSHSEFLQKERYKDLQKFGTKDYASWAHGLKEAGYATDTRYADKLIRIIETMNLHQLDF